MGDRQQELTLAPLTHIQRAGQPVEGLGDVGDLRGPVASTWRPRSPADSAWAVSANCRSGRVSRRDAR